MQHHFRPSADDHSHAHSAPVADPTSSDQDPGHHHPAEPAAEFDVATFLTQEFWDGRYRSAPVVWSGKANPVLVREVSRRPVGDALDVGAGEGGDAVWLAGLGWRVTAVDLSPVALERGAAAARAAGDEIAGRIRWQQADAMEWTPEPASYDLVTAQFVHLPQPQLTTVHRALAAAVRPGGMFLVVNHHPVDNEALGRPPMPGMFTVSEEMVAALDPAEWSSIEASAPTRPVSVEGRELTVTDTVLRAIRRT